MSDTIKDKFPQDDPRVAVGAAVTRVNNGRIKAIGRITKVTRTQIQVEGLYPGASSRCDDYRWHRDTGIRLAGGGAWGSSERVRLTTDLDRTELGLQQEAEARAAAERKQLRAEVERQMQANADARLRWFADAIRAAAGSDQAITLLREFATQVQMEGLGADWQEPEGHGHR